VTERELARGAARRLAIIRHAQEVSGNVSLTCRYYGVSRQVFYKWLRRYEEQGVEGLRDRLWRWPDVPRWFAARYKDKSGRTLVDAPEDPHITAMVNGYLNYRRYLDSLSDEDRKRLEEAAG
jgi:hypothetical protein